MSLRLFSRAWQGITKLKKGYDKGIFHPYDGVPAEPTVVSFCMLGGNNDVITRTKF